MIRVLILGINPFEDVPGYQLLSMLKTSGEYHVIAADDSAEALALLSGMGTAIESLPHPSEDPRRFAALVMRICDERGVDLLLPGADAHMYTLAACLHEQPRLARLCPALEWLSSKRLLNKVHVQQWASAFARTPERWAFEDESDAALFAAESRYPLMVKGVRKGAQKCDDRLEAVVARRTALRNPANQGEGGGVYAEALVEGEERSLFLLCGARGERLRTFSFRKLAVTQLGTTIAAQVDRELPDGIAVEEILEQLSGPAVLELEWRKDDAGRPWLFEINIRFPSWIGALGAHGMNLLEDYVDRVLHTSRNSPPQLEPLDGSIFYRLPQSGFLRLETAFARSDPVVPTWSTVQRYGKQTPLLWNLPSPHQFRVK